MEIRYLKYEEIDKEKWDKCINKSVNGIVYAYSWYLDIVSKSWDAMVMGDYKAVMPITSQKKYGINYIFQPKYAQQLGVFSIGLLDESLVNRFFEQLPKLYKVIDINLSAFNKFSLSKFKIKKLVTYELDLIGSYESIFAGFNSNTKRNLKKARKNKISVTKHVDLKDFLKLKKETAIEPITEEHLNILKRIIPFSIKYNIGTTYGAYNERNELIAAVFIIKSHNKAIYLLAASSNEGKKLSAMFSIVDTFIFDNAEKNLTLDFEGSMVEGIARFYKGFGAVPVTYSRIKQNRLPWPLSILK